MKQNGNHTQSNESSENVPEPDEVKLSSPVREPEEVKQSSPVRKPAVVRNFDLNLEPDENMDFSYTPTPVRPCSPRKPISEEKIEEYPGWSLSDMEKMAIDPIQLASLHNRIDEDMEDYDEEV